MDICSVLTTVILLSAYFDMRHAYAYPQDSCEDQRAVGKVLSFESIPAETNSGPGPVDMTMRFQTPFKPRAEWMVKHYIETQGVESHYHAVYSFPVPEKDTGSIRARTEYEGSDTYAFSLHIDSVDSDLTVFLKLYLNHPCNVIKIRGDVNLWKHMSGRILPTALHTPKPIVDLRDKLVERMKVGLMVDTDDMDIINTNSYFRTERRSDELHHRSGRGSNKGSVLLDWISQSEVHMRMSRQIFENGSLPLGELEGMIVFTKDPEKLADIQAVTIKSMCYLEIPGQYGRSGALSVGARTHVLLTHGTTGPALGLTVYQLQSKLLRNQTSGVSEFYETDGTRLLPIIDELNAKIGLPSVFSCFAERAGHTPSIAVAEFNGDGNDFNDARVLRPLTGSGYSGTAYNTYEVPALSVGEKSDFICSAAAGDDVTSLFFRIVKTKAVDMTTKMASLVDLQKDIFKNGFNFTCRTEGDPSPNVTFYTEGEYSMGYKPYLSSILGMVKHYDGLKDLDRFDVVTNGDEVTLQVSPGGNPFPWEPNAFRLICLGMNQFTADLAYVDFIDPNFNGTFITD